MVKYRVWFNDVMHYNNIGTSNRGEILHYGKVIKGKMLKNTYLKDCNNRWIFYGDILKNKNDIFIVDKYVITLLNYKKQRNSKYTLLKQYIFSSEIIGNKYEDKDYIHNISPKSILKEI